MDWSTGLSVGASLLGGLGGSKEGERDAKDAVALANQRLVEAQRNAKASVQPFVESGTQANRLLSQYLGTDTSGYAPRPTREQAAAEIRSQHFEKYGTDYGRNSSMGWVEKKVDALYNKRLADWEQGLEQYKQDNPDAMGDGRLLKEFTNEDFVKDPGHNFELAEGEKGIDRALAARGSRNSGAALKAIAKYNSDFASTKFNQAFQRDAQNKNTTYNFLSGQSSQGLNAAQNSGNQSIGVAQAIGNNNQNLSNTLLNLSNQRQDNQSNAIQSAIGNYIYGSERAKNSSVVGNSGNYVPSNGGSSRVPTPFYS